MSSKEALNLLSIIKLGIDLGAFPEEEAAPRSTNCHRHSTGAPAKDVATKN